MKDFVLLSSKLYSDAPANMQFLTDSINTYLDKEYSLYGTMSLIANKHGEVIVYQVVVRE